MGAGKSFSSSVDVIDGKEFLGSMTLDEGLIGFGGSHDLALKVVSSTMVDDFICFPSSC